MITPPFAVPSSLVSTNPVTPSASWNWRACWIAFWPVVASTTSSTSCGALSCALASVRFSRFSSSMRFALVCRRPAVSQRTTSRPSPRARATASNRTAPGSEPSFPRTIGTCAIRPDVELLAGGGAKGIARAEDHRSSRRVQAGHEAAAGPRQTLRERAAPFLLRQPAARLRLGPALGFEARLLLGAGPRLRFFARRRLRQPPRLLLRFVGLAVLVLRAPSQVGDLAFVALEFRPRRGGTGLARHRLARHPQLLLGLTQLFPGALLPRHALDRRRDHRSGDPRQFDRLPLLRLRNLFREPRAARHERAREEGHDQRREHEDDGGGSDVGGFQGEQHGAAQIAQEGGKSKDALTPAASVGPSCSRHRAVAAWERRAARRPPWRATCACCRCRCRTSSPGDRRRRPGRRSRPLPAAAARPCIRPSRRSRP